MNTQPIAYSLSDFKISNPLPEPVFNRLDVPLSRRFDAADPGAYLAVEGFAYTGQRAARFSTNYFYTAPDGSKWQLPVDAGKPVGIEYKQRQFRRLLLRPAQD